MRSTILLFFLLFSISLQATNGLIVLDPKKGNWTSKKGTIEQATLSVKPVGLYMECGLYLTFSARGTTTFASNDTLEVVLDFELPAGAIVHDSWLWIGNDIVKARLLDKWTATSIYEGIVKRRQDPSLLTKSSATQYQLRVFPMRRDEVRKVKITYLMPATWTASDVSMNLPFSILKTSFNTVQDFPLLVYTNEKWQSPSIQTQPNVIFTPFTDPDGNNYQQASLKPAQYTDANRLRFPAPFVNGAFLQTFQNNDESIYQLAYLPNTAVATARSRRIAVVVDLEASTNYPADDVLTALKSQLLSGLTINDSFNIFLGGNLDPVQASATWLPADPGTIEKTFLDIKNKLGTYSILPSVLAKAIDFVNKSNSPNHILLVSNSTAFNSSSLAGKLYSDLINIISPNTNIHIADFNGYTKSHYVNGIYYYGNEYLFTNLAKYTGGIYENIRKNPAPTLGELIGKALGNTQFVFEDFDLHTTLQQGFCYGRINLSDLNSLNPTTVIRQVGKYKGSLPLVVEIAGEYLSVPFFASTSVAETTTPDSLLREIWYGNFVNSLENQYSSNNSIVADIITNSLSERVLSIYTAFICLEDTSLICPTCKDETQLVDSKDVITPDSSLRAYPNPFSDLVTIEVATPESVKSGSLRVEFYNAAGKLVQQLSTPYTPGTTKITWNGLNTDGEAMPAGVYIAMVNLGNKLKVLKLVKTE